MWTDICYLGEIREIENDVGDIITEITYFTEDKFIFCNEKSITDKEFYQAATTDYKPSVELEVKASDYNGQRFIKYYDEEYTVYKSKKVGSENIALTLERGIKHERTAEGT